MIEPSPQENKSEVTNPNPEQSGVVLDDKNKENETVTRLKESQIVPEEEKKEEEKKEEEKKENENIKLQMQYINNQNNILIKDKNNIINQIDSTKKKI